jgi:hypothetical protein
MKNTKKTQKPTFIVVVAEYDEGGSDGLCIDNAIIYDSVDAVVDFITEDYDDTLINAFGEGDEPQSLSTAEVKKAVKRLKVGDNTEWDTPSDCPVWVKWKVFRKS